MTEPTTKSPSTTLLIGILLGSALTALLTPKSGTDLRTALKEKARDAKSNVEDRASKAESDMSSVINDAKETVIKEAKSRDIDS